MERINIILGVSNVFSAVLGILLVRPLVQRRVKMNPYYGVRFRKSYVSDELWYAINEYGGRRMIFWSWPLLAIGIATFFVPLKGNFVLTVTFSMAPMIYLIPSLESYLYARRIEE